MGYRGTLQVKPQDARPFCPSCGEQLDYDPLLGCLHCDPRVRQVPPDNVTWAESHDRSVAKAVGDGRTPLWLRAVSFGGLAVLRGLAFLDKRLSKRRGR
jgi:hypothetical protein